MGNSFRELCNKAGQRRWAEAALRRKVRQRLFKLEKKWHVCPYGWNGLVEGEIDDRGERGENYRSNVLE